MHLLLAPLVLLAAQTLASGVRLGKRACPNIHIFGARETTAPPGYGTAGVIVNLVLNAHPGSTSEAINYPACGGQASCGGVSYANSVIAGVRAVAAAINSFNTQCPNTQLVLVGYSQGGQIMDDAFCGGGDTNEGLSDTSIPIQPSAINKIAAAIFMGDPRHIPGLSYNVGTCNANGFAPRPVGFQCPSAAKIKSYCDAADPYCCNGNDPNTHQGYGTEYGQQALSFINTRLNAAPGGGTTTPAPTSPTTAPPNPTGGGTVPHWGQCGGMGWVGSTVCVAPFTCQALSQWYSQCL